MGRASAVLPGRVSAVLPGRASAVLPGRVSVVLLGRASAVLPTGRRDSPAQDHRQLEDREEIVDRRHLVGIVDNLDWQLVDTAYHSDPAEEESQDREVVRPVERIQLAQPSEVAVQTDHLHFEKNMKSAEHLDCE